MASDITYLATIAQHDYPAFRLLPGNDLPATYDGWLNLLDRQTAHYREIRNTIVYVRVDADEFARFCGVANTPHNLNSLYGLTHEKGLRQQN